MMNILKRVHTPPFLQSHKNGPIRALSLVSDRYFPPDSASASSSSSSPILILHGLFGGRKNWTSLGKTISKALKREVVAVDLRNHGESPHSLQASHRDMASDVVDMIYENGWDTEEDLTIIGHSMGGKVAMTLALSGEVPLSKLVVVDIAPTRSPISPVFSSYMEAMQEIEAAQVKSRREADLILQKYEKELSVRQFLLTNLVSTEGSKTYSFRIPLPYLSGAISKGAIADFPYAPLPVGEEGDRIENDVRDGPNLGDGETRQWDGPALFLKGGKSNYINEDNVPIIKAFFPKAELKTLDAGHWVHAEQPKQFVEELASFLRKS